MNKQEEKKLKRIPDVINNSATKNFTQVPNDLLRNPEISGKAKALLCLLLSNQEGWYSYMTTLQKMMKEGKDAIYSGLKELEKFGYLRRIPYRNKETGQWTGSFWAYTDFPNKFNMNNTIQFLDSHGYYINEKDLNFSENPDTETPETETTEMGTPPLIIPSIKNTNLKNNNSTSRSSKKEEENFLAEEKNKCPVKKVKASASKKKKSPVNIPDNPSAKKASVNNKENGYITPALFDEFWQIYPRKVDKGKAKTIWKRLCDQKKDRPQWNVIKQAVIEQKQTERWEEPKFIPHPSTWLNQSRWEDDPAQMKIYKKESSQNKPSNWYREKAENRNNYSF